MTTGRQRNVVEGNNVLTTVKCKPGNLWFRARLDWRGVAYAVVLTARDGERGQSGYCR